MAEYVKRKGGSVAGKSIQPYDAMVYKDADTGYTMAIDKNGNVIKKVLSASNTDDVAIQAAISDSVYRRIIIMSGTYYVSNTVCVVNSDIEFNSGSIIKPVSDIDIFSIMNNVHLAGCTIDVRDIVYSSSCILLDGVNRILPIYIDSPPERTGVYIERIAFINDEYTGKAIYIVADSNDPEIIGSSYVCGVTINDIKILRFEYGIKIYQNWVLALPAAWINGVYVNNVWHWQHKYIICTGYDGKLEGSNGYIFENIFGQSSWIGAVPTFPDTPAVIIGSHTSIVKNLFTWDWWEPIQGPMVYLTPHSDYCQVHVIPCGNPAHGRYVLDAGINNTSILENGIIKMGAYTLVGNAATDLPTYSAEFLDADNWTSVNWTGSWAAGWTHTTGNTSVLSHDHAAVVATKYQVAYVVTGQTAGTFTIMFGGQTSAAISGTGAWGPTATGTGVLQITPTSNFDGTIVISIKSITAVSTPICALTNSAGMVIFEQRIGNWNTNVFLGRLAGGYNSTGYENIAIGPYSLYSNTTGNTNIAIGVNSLYSNTTGIYNAAIGMNALYYNTIGYQNLAMGYHALYKNINGSGNVAVGYNALINNTSGINNVGVGASCLGTNSTGNYNVAFGRAAGYTLTGSSNTCIGYYAGYNDNQLATAVNSMALGANSFCNRSNQVVIGDASVVETHLRTGVYIGSTSTTAHTQPTARLHIAAGSATASTAPLKLTSGPVNTTSEAGAIEFDGTDFYLNI